MRREFEECEQEIGGVATRFLVAGDGPPMVALHALGDNRLDWQWTLGHLATTHRVYAPDLPGFGGTGTPADCSPEYFQGFAHAFLDALDLESAVLVGSSLGGLVALRLALQSPARVSGLCLVASAGLGREINPALCQLALPGIGEAATWWGRTRIGAAQRAALRVPLVFANPAGVRPEWVATQYRLARLPGFLDTTLAALRGQVALHGQKEILVDDLPRLSVPTLLVWGRRDLVVPVDHARRAARLVPCAALELISGAGHLPHVERPVEFAAALSTFAARCRRT